MSLKAELEAWASALHSYDEDDLESALEQFEAIATTSKIFVNIGLIHATLGEHELAVDRFRDATDLDKYLGIAYFQSGVSNFLLSRYELALTDFDNAHLYLRGNDNINYEQLGLKFKLFSAEVLFNKGLSLIYMGRTEDGIAEMQDAQREKQTDDHSVIDEAIADKGDGYTVFSIPVGVLYRPSESKLKNAKTKDYLGKAKLVSAADSNDEFTTFTGVTRLRQGMTPNASSFVEGGLTRSLTSPTVRKSEPMAPAPLARSKTTVNATPQARERMMAAAAPPASPGLARSASMAAPASKPLTRSNSMGGPAAAAPTRGLTVRKNVPKVVEAPAPIPEQAEGEFYDDYLDAYQEEEEGKPEPAHNDLDRTAAWASKTAEAPARPASVIDSVYTGSSASSAGSIRRKMNKRTHDKNAESIYEDEEEGYGSGEYDDAPLELTKIRVKLYWKDDIRGMALNPDIPFEEFFEMVTAKFGLGPHDLSMKFTDEDGGKVSLMDDSDYEMAIETARESAQGKAEGKLQVWCTSV